MISRLIASQLTIFVVCLTCLCHCYLLSNSQLSHKLPLQGAVNTESNNNAISNPDFVSYNSYLQPKHGQIVSDMLYDIHVLTTSNNMNPSTINNIIFKNLKVIIRQIDLFNIENEYLTMNSYEIGKSFLGLQSISVDDDKLIYHNDIKKIIRVLTKSILYSVPNMDCRTVANVLLGLKSTTDSTAEIRELFNVLCKRIEQSQHHSWQNQKQLNDNSLFPKLSIDSNSAVSSSYSDSRRNDITSSSRSVTTNSISNSNSDREGILTKKPIKNNNFITFSSSTRSIRDKTLCSSQSNLLSISMDMKRFSMIMRGLKGMSSSTYEVSKFIYLLCDSLDHNINDNLVKNKLLFTKGEELSSVFLGLCCLSKSSSSSSTTYTEMHTSAKSTMINSVSSNENVGNRLLLLVSQLLKNQFLKQSLQSNSTSSSSNHSSDINSKNILNNSYNSNVSVSNDNNLFNSNSNKNYQNYHNTPIRSRLKQNNTFISLSGFSERHLASMMYGLQNMHFDFNKVPSKRRFSIDHNHNDNSNIFSGIVSPGIKATRNSAGVTSIYSTLSTLPKSVSADDYKFTQAKFIILEIIILCLHQFDESFSTLSLGNALYGLQNLDAQSSLVRLLVKLLNQKITVPDKGMFEKSVVFPEKSIFTSGHSIAMACYGLKSLGQKIRVFQNDHDESSNNNNQVEPFEKSSNADNETKMATNNKLSISTTTSGSNTNTVNTINTISSDSASIVPSFVLPNEVKKLVNTLAICISHTPSDSVSLTPSQFAMAMFGLQHMSVDTPAVRRLIQSLTDKVILSQSHSSVDTSPTVSRSSTSTSHTQQQQQLLISEPLTGKEITMIFQGMQNMGSEWIEVQNLLVVIGQLLNITTTYTNDETVVINKSLKNIQNSLKSKQDKDKCLTAWELATIVNSLQCMGGNIIALPPPSYKRPIMMELTDVTVPVDNTIVVTDTVDNTITSSNNTTVLKRLRIQQQPQQQSPSPLQRKKFKPPIALLSVLDIIVNKFEHRIERLSSVSVAAALFGLQGFSNELSPIKHLLRYLTDDLIYSNYILSSPTFLKSLVMTNVTNRDATTQSSTAEVAVSMSMTESMKKIRSKIFTISSSKFNNTKQMPIEDKYGPLDSRSMSNAIYGLQNMTSKSVYVTNLLNALSDAIDLSPHTLTAQGVGNSLYGLQNMNDKSPSVRKLLRALTQKIWSMPWSLEDLSQTPYNINSNGGSDMVIDKNISISQKRVNNSDFASIKENEYMKEYMSDKIHDIESFDAIYMLSGQNIGNALWGLRNMSSQCVEVRNLLRVLALRIEKSVAEMNGQNIGNAFYSLHGMSNTDELGREVIEVTEILSALANKLVASNSIFSSLDIGMALYGLRNMNTESPIVRAILKALIIKLKNSPSKMHLKPLLMAIMGLLHTSSEIKDDFLQLLVSKTPGMTYMG